ncbi:MAG: hypothetical protein R6W82_07945 [bacterium]
MLRIPALPYPLFRGLLGLLMRTDITLIGARNIPDGPCIACSNHPHREEILLGYRIFQRPVHIMLQKGLFDRAHLEDEFRAALEGTYRFPGWVEGLAPIAAEWIARQNTALGAIPVAREKDVDDPRSALLINRSAFHLAIRALERGHVIGMAPEGVLSPEEGVGQLQKGAAQMAWHFARRDRPVPLLPIIFWGIRGLDKSLFGRGRAIVAVGEPLPAVRKDGEGRKAYTDRVTGELREDLIDLMEHVKGIPTDALPPAPTRSWGRIEAPPIGSKGSQSL